MAIAVNDCIVDGVEILTISSRIVVAAVATLLGIGWYFSNAQVVVQSPAAKVAEGAYVPSKMVYPKDPSLARNVEMNDELLILDEHSEDRLSLTR